MSRIQASGFVALFTLLLSTIASAQFSPPERRTSVDIQVRVTYMDDRAAGNQIRVDLLNDTGIAVEQTFTDSEGRAGFHVSSSGNYRVRATGMDIEEGVSETVHIDDMDRSRMIFVHVAPKSDSIASKKTPGTGPVTSAAELRIPPDARKAFHKGLEAWEKKDYQKAAGYFEKATAQYPQYDNAYNNLGVMYAHLNQPEKARAAFEKSVELNDKNADADRNLARLLLRDREYPRAETLLRKSLIVEPLNPVSLTLVSIAEIESGNVDGALQDARKVHELPHDGYALSHFVAGQALERKHQLQEAGAEYQTYLRENPNGPEAPLVQKALARLSAPIQQGNAQ